MPQRFRVQLSVASKVDRLYGSGNSPSHDRRVSRQRQPSRHCHQDDGAFNAPLARAPDEDMPVNAFNPTRAAKQTSNASEVHRPFVHRLWFVTGNARPIGRPRAKGLILAQHWDAIGSRSPCGPGTARNWATIIACTASKSQSRIDLVRREPFCIPSDYVDHAHTSEYFIPCEKPRAVHTTFSPPGPLTQSPTIDLRAGSPKPTHRYVICARDAAGGVRASPALAATAMFVNNLSGQSSGAHGITFIRPHLLLTHLTGSSSLARPNGDLRNGDRKCGQ